MPSSVWGGNSNVRIRLSRYVHLVALQAEGVDKILPKSHELLCHVVLVLGSDRALRETGPDWLLHIDNVGEVMPAPWILDRRVCAGSPCERTVFLQQAVKR